MTTRTTKRAPTLSNAALLWKRGALPTARLAVAALVVGLLPACSAPESTVGRSSEPIVYGTDDRLEVYQASAALQMRARQSIVALVEASKLDLSDPLKGVPVNFVQTGCSVTSTGGFPGSGTIGVDGSFSGGSSDGMTNCTGTASSDRIDMTCQPGACAIVLE